MAYTCKEAIIGVLKACGGQEFNDLKMECRRQATDYTPETFLNALYALVREGVIGQIPDYEDASAYDLIENL
jgi:hypothetical protein